MRIEKLDHWGRVAFFFLSLSFRFSYRRHLRYRQKFFAAYRLEAGRLFRSKMFKEHRVIHLLFSFLFSFFFPEISSPRASLLPFFISSMYIYFTFPSAAPCSFWCLLSSLLPPPLFVSVPASIHTTLRVYNVYVSFFKWKREKKKVKEKEKGMLLHSIFALLLSQYTGEMKRTEDMSVWTGFAAKGLEVP